MPDPVRPLRDRVRRVDVAGVHRLLEDHVGVLIRAVEQREQASQGAADREREPAVARVRVTELVEALDELLDGRLRSASA